MEKQKPLVIMGSVRYNFGPNRDSIVHYIWFKDLFFLTGKHEQVIGEAARTSSNSAPHRRPKSCKSRCLDGAPSLFVSAASSRANAAERRRKRREAMIFILDVVGSVGVNAVVAVSRCAKL